MKRDSGYKLQMADRRQTYKACDENDTIQLQGTREPIIIEFVQITLIP